MEKTPIFLAEMGIQREKIGKLAPGLSKKTIIYCYYRENTIKPVVLAYGIGKKQRILHKTKNTRTWGIPKNRNPETTNGFIIFRYFTFIHKYAKDREYRGEIMYRREVLWHPTRTLTVSCSS